MCGVIGAFLRDVKQQDLELVEEIYRQSMIRGKHATGVSYIKHKQLVTVKEPVPVTEFLKTHSVSEWVDETTLLMAGHVRYSTSSREHNQPFDNGYVCYNETLVDRSRKSVMTNMTNNSNQSLIVGRQGQAVAGDSWNLIFTSNTISDLCLFIAFKISLYAFSVLFIILSLIVFGNSL